MLNIKEQEIYELARAERIMEKHGKNSLAGVKAEKEKKQKEKRDEKDNNRNAKGKSK